MRVKDCKYVNFKDYLAFVGDFFFFVSDGKSKSSRIFFVTRGFKLGKNIYPFTTQKAIIKKVELLE